MYADKITDSMRKTIEETDRRREKQLKYNELHGITPTPLVKSTDSIMGQTSVAGKKTAGAKTYVENTQHNVAADPVVQYMNKDQIEKTIQKTKKKMEEAVKELDFIVAAQMRDEIFDLQELLKSKHG